VTVAYNPDLDRLLTAGSRYESDHATYVIEPHDLDPVVLPTGHIVGCDPFVFADGQPAYTVSVPPGTYPLRAWVAVLYKDPAVEWQRRVVALQLLVRDEPVARWDMALIEDEDVATLPDNRFFGYGVDAGTGTLADLVAVRALAEWEYERVDDVFIPAQLPLAPVPGLVSAVTDPPTGANVVTVTSGWGDGVYPTFIGYTAGGEIASFVTDFLVVPDQPSP
jgi:hypothetical protein